MGADIRRRLLVAASPHSLREWSRLFHVAVYERPGEVVAVGGVELNEIRLLYVSPSCRHQGIGRQLLDYLESLVPPDLFADISVYSTEGALGFYRKCGYQPEGEHEFALEGTRLPTIFMRKRLHA